MAVSPKVRAANLRNTRYLFIINVFPSLLSKNKRLNVRGRVIKPYLQQTMKLKLIWDVLVSIRNTRHPIMARYLVGSMSGCRIITSEESYS